MPRKKSAGSSLVGIRDAVRAKWQHRAARWSHVPEAPWPRLLAQLDAGDTVLVTYVDLIGTGAPAVRGGRYLLHPDGTITEDHYIDRPAAMSTPD